MRRGRRRRKRAAGSSLEQSRRQPSAQHDALAYAQPGADSNPDPDSDAASDTNAPADAHTTADADAASDGHADREPRAQLYALRIFMGQRRHGTHQRSRWTIQPGK